MFALELIREMVPVTQQKNAKAKMGTTWEHVPRVMAFVASVSIVFMATANLYMNIVTL